MSSIVTLTRYAIDRIGFRIYQGHSFSLHFFLGAPHLSQLFLSLLDIDVQGMKILNYTSSIFGRAVISFDATLVLIAVGALFINREISSWLLVRRHYDLIVS